MPIRQLKWELELATPEELPHAINQGGNDCCGRAGILIEHVGKGGKPSQFKAPYKLTTYNLHETEAAKIIYFAQCSQFARARIRVVVCSHDEGSAAGIAVLFLRAAGWRDRKARLHVAKFTTAKPSPRFLRAAERVMVRR